MIDTTFALVLMAHVLNTNTHTPLLLGMYDGFAACEAVNVRLLEDGAIQKRGECIPMEALEGINVLVPAKFQKVEAPAEDESTMGTPRPQLSPEL